MSGPTAAREPQCAETDTLYGYARFSYRQDPLDGYPSSSCRQDAHGYPSSSYRQDAHLLLAEHRGRLQGPPPHVIADRRQRGGRASRGVPGEVHSADARPLRPSPKLVSSNGNNVAGGGASKDWYKTGSSTCRPRRRSRSCQGVSAAAPPPAPRMEWQRRLTRARGWSRVGGEVAARLLVT